MTDLENARAAVDETTPEGWYAGRAGHEERHNQWWRHAFDPSETPIVGKRSREWVTVGRTELECVRGVARRFGERREGRWPDQGGGQSARHDGATRQVAPSGRALAACRQSG